MNNKETLNTYNGRLSTNNDTITNINSLLKRLPVGGEDLPEELTNYDSGLTTHETSIQDIIKAIEGKAAGGGSEPNLQDKSIEITENGTTNIVADEGYDGLNNVEVIANVEGIGGKYAPRIIRFTDYAGTELNEELSNLDTSNITSMKSVFNGCANLQGLDLSNFNTSNVTDMSYMFYKCSSLTNLELSNFDTSNVTIMMNMFANCGKLSSINLQNLDTSKVTNMNSMFSACLKLNKLDLSNCNTSTVTNMTYMFYNCKALTELDIRLFSFSNVKNYSDMFYNVPVGCLIIVKDDTAKSWVLARRSDLTNVKTVAELEG